ncbi:MAG: nicotinate phosphoribosyltransferase, partial [Bacteroidota bacterium]
MNSTLSPLLTDLYQLTMAYGYWHQNKHEQESVFHLFFRKAPFGGAYAIAAGLELAIEWMQNFRFTDSELGYLQSLKGSDGNALFSADFLTYLGDMEFCCDIDAVPEGSLVFPHEPLLRVRGPLIQAQLLETALLNIINFSTLIATKASRINQIAGGESVLEFGLRRAQGPDGGLSASRAAYIGGCSATSNVLAGYRYGIPVKGTHAHSWVMSYPSEQEAFAAYAEAMPNNCIFLVDTYDTIEGVREAIKMGQQLRSQGHEMLGVRLDSGDLAQLSIESRKLLDEAGFPGAAIVASNDLDEHRMQALKEKGAKINVWGVGTRLATGGEQPALGGVYKLAALRDENGDWDYKIKLSEQAIKVSNPGLLNVRRYEREGRYCGDEIWNEDSAKPQGKFVGFDGQTHDLSEDEGQDLLIKIFSEGELVYEIPPLANARDHCLAQITKLPQVYRALKTRTAFPGGL